MPKVPLFFLVALGVLFGCASSGTVPSKTAAPDFVSIREIDPTIIVELRYLTDHNFLGRRVAGYKANKCLLARPAAEALASVQRAVKPFSLALKVYDCYRPQRAVNDFIAWAKDAADTKTKAEFYPNVDKKDAFKLGYLATHSGHSRGSTLDLTLVPLPLPPQEVYHEGQRLEPCHAPRGKRFGDNSLDMGTGYDCFDPLAHTANPAVGQSQKQNRLLLKTLMERAGFQNYGDEWWHFSLQNEPYPETYFDFEVE